MRKAKPLVRVAERETAAYALLKGIDYVVEECPMVEGNTQHRYKDAITRLEETSPGTKQQFLFGFYKKGAAHFSAEPDGGEVVPCASCGAPTVRWGESEAVCSFCKTKARANARKLSGQTPVRKQRGKRGRDPVAPSPVKSSDEA